MLLPVGSIPSDVGDAEAPGALAVGIELAPLADMPALALAGGCVLAPLAENWFGLPGACCG
jgi:hypothetical protein